MALTHDEYFDLSRKIKMEQFHARIRVAGYDGMDNLAKLKEELESHRTIPKKGDLVIDHEWPNDGIGLVLEVGDRRKKAPYKLSTHLGADWYGKSYVEYQCRIVS